MHQLLFKNRFNALVFVAIILFSVRILVGTPNDSGAIEDATAKLGDKSETSPAPAREVVRAAPEPMATEFTSDEDLIDEASGDDASGWSAEPEFGDEDTDVEIADFNGVSDEG